LKDSALVERLGNLDWRRDMDVALDIFAASISHPGTRTVYLAGARRWLLFLARNGVSPISATLKDYENWVTEDRCHGLSRPTLLTHSSAVRTFYKWLGGAGFPISPETTDLARGPRRLPGGPQQPSLFDTELAAGHTIGALPPSPARAATASPRVLDLSREPADRPGADVGPKDGVVAEAPFARRELDELKAMVGQLIADTELHEKQLDALRHEVSDVVGLVATLPDQLKLDGLMAKVDQVAASTDAHEKQWGTACAELSKGLSLMTKLAESTQAGYEERLAWAKEMDGFYRRARSALCQQADTKTKDILLSQPNPGSSCKDEVMMLMDGNFPGLAMSDPGVIDGADTLDKDPQGQAWASKLHRALLMLDDYAQTEFDGDFKRFCEVAPRGHNNGVPTTWVAPHEPAATENNGRFRDKRTFIVPPEVDPSGKVYMPEHIILGNGGVGPRLYYFDDKNGPTHKVHIGYLGAHLPSRDTN
jgi:hypothetical protein